MILDPKSREDLGRHLARFCQRCPHVVRQVEGTRIYLHCKNQLCYLWGFFHWALKVDPQGELDAEARQGEQIAEHREEIRRFRGPLPELRPGHDWDADAEFHGLSPGRPRGRGRA